MSIDKDIEDIITPEIEKRFEGLSEEKQQEVMQGFSEVVNKMVGEWTSDNAPVRNWSEYVDFFRQTLIDKLDEVEGKRRGLWLL